MALRFFKDQFRMQSTVVSDLKKKKNNLLSKEFQGIPTKLTHFVVNRIVMVFSKK